MSPCVCMCVCRSTQFCSWSGRNWNFSWAEENGVEEKMERNEKRMGGGRIAVGWWVEEKKSSYLPNFHSHVSGWSLPGGVFRRQRGYWPEGCVFVCVELRLIIRGGEILLSFHFIVQSKAGVWQTVKAWCNNINREREPFSSFVAAWLCRCAFISE